MVTLDDGLRFHLVAALHNLGIERVDALLDLRRRYRAIFLT